MNAQTSVSFKRDCANKDTQQKWILTKKTILVLPVASGATNLLNIIPKLRRNLVWIKP